jgi:hypothetical protein
MTSGFDLNQQAAAAKKEDVGTVVHINGIDDMPLFYEADGKQLPVTITVAGAHSEKFRSVEAQFRKRKLKASRFTAEVVYDENIDKVTACTLAWEGFFVGGQPIEFTPKNVREVYKACSWVLEQVVEAMHDHSRYFTS